MTEDSEVARLVMRAVATACRLEESTIGLETKMSDIEMDSLTLVSILAQVEAIFDLRFTSDDIVQLLAACDVGALARSVSRIIIARAREPGRR